MVNVFHYAAVKRFIEQALIEEKSSKQHNYLARSEGVIVVNILLRYVAVKRFIEHLLTEVKSNEKDNYKADQKG